MQTVTDEIVPDFHNQPGVPLIEIGAKKFMCIGALPPRPSPSSATWAGTLVCPLSLTLYRHNPALTPNQARPAECEVQTTSPSDFMR